MAAFVIYRDINTLVGQNVDRELVDNEKAIRNSIYNIMTTPIGSRYRQPEYGSRLHQFVHEPSTSDSAFQLEALLVQSIARWKPRIQIVRPETSVTPLVSGGFDIVITYFIPKLSQISNLGLTVTR